MHDTEQALATLRRTLAGCATYCLIGMTVMHSNSTLSAQSSCRFTNYRIALLSDSARVPVRLTLKFWLTLLLRGPLHCARNLDCLARQPQLCAVHMLLPCYVTFFCLGNVIDTL